MCGLFCGWWERMHDFSCSWGVKQCNEDNFYFYALPPDRSACVGAFCGRRIIPLVWFRWARQKELPHEVYRPRQMRWTKVLCVSWWAVLRCGCGCLLALLLMRDDKRHLYKSKYLHIWSLDEFLSHCLWNDVWPCHLYGMALFNAVFMTQDGLSS